MPSPSDKARASRIKREAKIKKYREERFALENELKQLNARRSKISKRKQAISNAIFDLLHEDGDIPSVADHAIVRYLERVKGMDIQALKIEISSHKQAQRVGNTIVTVNEDMKDV